MGQFLNVNILQNATNYIFCNYLNLEWKFLDANLKLCEGVHSFSKLIWKVFKAKNLKTAVLFSHQMLRTAAAPKPQKLFWHRHLNRVPLTPHQIKNLLTTPCECQANHKKEQATSGHFSLCQSEWSVSSLPVL